MQHTKRKPARHSWLLLCTLGLGACVGELSGDSDTFEEFEHFAPASSENEDIEVVGEDGVVEVRNVDVYTDENPDEAGGDYTIFEGDIMVPIVRSADGSPARASFSSGNPWDNGVVPYTLDEDFTDAYTDTIRSAMAEIEDVAQIEFVERTDERDFVAVRSGTGCSSFIGRVGGVQSIILGRCSRGSVIHEFLHALGYPHEHTRPDRDDFVRIEWDNIIEGRRNNFVISPGERIGEYDLDSIMHYGGFFFSDDPNIPTITRRDDDTPVVANRRGLSDGDVVGLEQVYGSIIVNTAPNPAEGLRVSVHGPDSFELFWDAASDPDGDDVEYLWACGGSSRITGRTDGTSAYLSNRARGLGQVCFVYSVDTHGATSPPSEAVVVPVYVEGEGGGEGDNNPPSVTEGLRVSVYGRDNFELFWNRATDPDGDLVEYRWTCNGGPGPFNGRTDGTSAYVSNRSREHAHTCLVFTIDAHGATARASEAVLVPALDEGEGGGGAGEPSAVGNLRGTVYGGTNLEIFWDRASDADGHIAHYDITENGSPLPPRDGASLYRNGLMRDTEYHYEVIAVDNEGNRSPMREVTLTTRP